MDVVIRTASAAQTMAAGEALAPLLVAGDVVLLSGDLGAGKTQFAKGVAEGLGVVEPVTSPTFNILLVHQGRLPLYHFDLYRLEHAHELEDLDYYATLESDGVCLVEWGDRFIEAAPRSGLSIALSIEGDELRRIVVAPIGDRGDQLGVAWRSACASQGIGPGGV